MPRSRAQREGLPLHEAAAGPHLRASPRGGPEALGAGGGSHRHRAAHRKDSTGRGGRNRCGGSHFWWVGENKPPILGYLFFSGWIESDVRWGLTDLDFDPWAHGAQAVRFQPLGTIGQKQKSRLPGAELRENPLATSCFFFL